MIRIKDRADVRGLQDVMWDMVYDINPFYNELGHDLTITEGTGGTHSRASLHYVGLAVDIRTRMLKDKYGMFERIKSVLSSGFDVVFHDTHIHIEYQPKSQEERII